MPSFACPKLCPKTAITAAGRREDEQRAREGAGTRGGSVPKREELSLRTVLALPKASRTAGGGRRRAAVRPPGRRPASCRAGRARNPHDNADRRDGAGHYHDARKGEAGGEGSDLEDGDAGGESQERCSHTDTGSSPCPSRVSCAPPSPDNAQ